MQCANDVTPVSAKQFMTHCNGSPTASVASRVACGRRFAAKMLQFQRIFTPTSFPYIEQVFQRASLDTLGQQYRQLRWADAQPPTEGLLGPRLILYPSRYPALYGLTRFRREPEAVSGHRPLVVTSDITSPCGASDPHMKCSLRPRSDISRNTENLFRAVARRRMLNPC